MISFNRPAAASTVIRNTGTHDDLWKQVTEGWKQVSPVSDTMPIIHKESVGDMLVQRGRPRDSQSIADLITRLSKGQHRMNSEQVMEAFGDKAYLLLHASGKLVGLAGWQVENLVTRTTDIFLEEHVDLQKSLEILIKEVERASGELQSEASLIFPLNELAAQEQIWKHLGYEKRTPETLGVQAWQDSAREANPVGGALLFKQLRQDRLLRPI